ncbi:MAG: hypothetical protein IPO31_24800 [Candidatus Obscuribacter sp.]|nr:hypothetical protein [Candidatus Obscuribacter sp.]
MVLLFCLSIVASGQDVEAIGRMMVLFGDIALPRLYPPGLSAALTATNQPVID